MDALIESLVDRDYFRAKLLPFTRKAFRIIPRLSEPTILDIGCGSGVVTLELAALSNGRVTGVDIDNVALARLERRIEKAGLSTRVKTINCSMDEMKFGANSFDIVWSEGAIFVIGFDKGLVQWRSFVRPDGFLVVHARKIEIEKRVGMIPEFGYSLLNKFLVPKDAWWNLYYEPLEKHINLLRQRYQDDACKMVSLNTVQKEIDEFKQNPKYHGSVFYVCQKAGGEQS